MRIRLATMTCWLGVGLFGLAVLSTAQDERVSPGQDARVPPEAQVSAKQSAFALIGDPRIDALLSGYAWSNIAEITYSFYNFSIFQGKYQTSDAASSNYSEPSAAMQSNIRQIMSRLEQWLPFSFTEVSETASNIGLIRFLLDPSASYAFAYYPYGQSMWSFAGNVHFNPGYDGGGTNGFQSPPGSHGYQSILHELGHALGLKHSFEAPNALPSNQDNQSNTVMTYTFSSAEPCTYMPYDFLALNHLYKLRPYRNTDDDYRFSRLADQYTTRDNLIFLDPSWNTKQTLWDAGGFNLLDFSGVAASASGYTFDLREGGWLIENGQNHSTYYERGCSLAWGTSIRAVNASANNDTFWLNPLANRIGGYLKGSSAGNDTINLAASTDFLDLTSYHTDEVVQTPSGQDLVLTLGTDGNITLKDFFNGSQPQIVFWGTPTPVINLRAISDFAQLKIYPQPAQNQQPVRFINLPFNASITLYDLRGLVIQQLYAPAGEALWDTRDQQGRWVKRAIVLYAIQTPSGLKKSGKIMVLP